MMVGMSGSETFGQRLGRLRRHRGLSQNKLNELLGLTQGYVNRMESGQRANPGMDILMGLAQHLQISLDYLVFGIGEDPTMPATEGDLRPLHTRKGWLQVRERAQSLRRKISPAVFEQAGTWSAPGERLTVDLVIKIAELIFFAEAHGDEAAVEAEVLAAASPPSSAIMIDGPPPVSTPRAIATQKKRR